MAKLRDFKVEGRIIQKGVAVVRAKNYDQAYELAEGLSSDEFCVVNDEVEIDEVSE
jgi:hypothetical protein